METRILLILLVFLTIFDSEAQSLRAEFAMAEFSSPTDGPYLETYLKLKGKSLITIESESGNYSEVLITYHISKGVWIPFKDTYKIKSPVSSGKAAPMDFIDQRRIPLKAGTYDMEITIKDADEFRFDGNGYLSIIPGSWNSEDNISFFIFHFRHSIG
jgi:hypothetical protein